jgi:DUF4097 and DUF4098 domain-containing protein YvlB
MPLPALAQQETETVDRTIPFPSGGTLELKNFSGRVNITAGSGSNVVIKAVRRARRDRLDTIKLTIDTSGSTVTINANDRADQRRDRNRDGDNNNVVQTDFDISLPATARLNFDVFSSDLTVTGITGRQTLKTFSGDIVAKGVSGPIEAESFSGSIDLDLTAAGKNPDVSAGTFSGGIRLRLAADAGGRVEFDSFSGSFDSDLPITLRSSGRRKVIGDLPGGDGRMVRLKTFSGDARIVR